MRVFCILSELMSESGVSARELAKELKIDVRTIRKLEEYREPWRLSQESFEKLTLYAYDHGYEGLFVIRPNPIWENFIAKPCVLFRASLGWDAEAETHLNRLFGKLDCIIETQVGVSDPEVVEEKMKTRNCVMLGAPKSNPASEVALALLWGARPFVGSEKNRGRIPVHFRGMKGTEGERRSALIRENGPCGIDIMLPSGERKIVPVSWMPPSEYAQSTENGSDAAVLVFCNRPLGTDRPVTTLILAGYTGRATLRAVKEATHRELPISECDLEKVDQPHLSVMTYDFTKVKQGKRPRMRGLRTEIQDSVLWGPPWPPLFQAIRDQGRAN